MMSDHEREEFSQSAAARATEALARGTNVPTALSPLFQNALQEHPDEDDRLLAVWDRLTSRRIV